MNILHWLTIHRHYWGIPHERPSDKRLIQICYECGAERKMRIDLRPTQAPADREIEEQRARAA